MKTLNKSDVIKYLDDINKKNEEFGCMILKSIASSGLHVGVKWGGQPSRGY